MSSARRKLVIRHPVAVDVGCSCRWPKLPSFCYTLAKSKSTEGPSLLSPSAAISLSETLTPSTMATTTTTATMTTTATVNSSSPSRYGDFASSPSPPFRAQATGRKGKKNWKRVASSRKAVVEESTAVVKDSSDPYLDFRDSMLQMIVEMEIYSWDDLRDLLHRFLGLNAVATITSSSVPSQRSGRMSSRPPNPRRPPPPRSRSSDDDGDALSARTEKAQKRKAKV